MTNIKYTQSLVKDFERINACQVKMKAKWVDKDPRLSLSNEYTLRGQYFEWLVIGGSAHSKDDVTDLPRLRNGEKSAVQVRIENQAIFAKDLIKKLGFTLVTSQLKLSDNDEEGTIDAVFSDADGNIWVTDLKLTSDVESTRTVYGYGNDWSEMDQLQLLHYGNLYEIKYKIKPRLALFVFDYSPKMGYLLQELSFAAEKFEERNARFIDVKSIIKSAELNNNWEYKPSESECSNCPLICKYKITNES